MAPSRPRPCPFPLGAYAGGAPETLSVLLEGESLFNDASSLTLFEIFKELILEQETKVRAHDHPHRQREGSRVCATTACPCSLVRFSPGVLFMQPLGEEIGHIIVKTIETALIGVAVGMAMGIFNK